MKRKCKAVRTVACIGFLIPTVLFLSACEMNSGRSARKAIKDACDTFVMDMAKSKRSGAVQRVGVFRIGSGDTGKMARESLHNALIRHTGLDIIGMDDMREKEQILDTLGKQFEYRRRYNSDTLVKLGDMIAVNCIVTGRVVDFQPKVKSSRVAFQGQVLDLGAGRILYSDLVEGTHVKPVTAAEIGISIAVAVLAFGLMGMLSNLDSFYGREYEEVLKRRVMQFTVIALTAAGFAVYYLVLR